MSKVIKVIYLNIFLHCGNLQQSLGSIWDILRLCQVTEFTFFRLNHLYIPSRNLVLQWRHMAWWHVKPPASRLLVEKCIEANIKMSMSRLTHFLWVDPLANDGYSSQRPDNAENVPMGLLPDTLNCWLRMCREFRDRFLRHRLQRKLLVSDPGMYHGMCVTHVPWCMSGALTRSAGKNVAAFPEHAQTTIWRIWKEAHAMASSRKVIMLMKRRVVHLIWFLLRPNILYPLPL